MNSYESYFSEQTQMAMEKHVADRVYRTLRNRARKERRRSRRKNAMAAVTIGLAASVLIAACAAARTSFGGDEGEPAADLQAVSGETLSTAPIPVEGLAIEADEGQIQYTAEELEMLALVIYQEAGGDSCSDDTRLKVGTVVMNRVADDRYPDTIEEVLTEERQYGRLHWTGLVWPERAELPQEAYAVARAYECAKRILAGERYLPADVIFQSEHIQGEIVAEQDGFYFCRTEAKG